MTAGVWHRAFRLSAWTWLFGTVCFLPYVVWAEHIPPWAVAGGAAVIGLPVVLFLSRLHPHSRSLSIALLALHLPLDMALIAWLAPELFQFGAIGGLLYLEFVLVPALVSRWQKKIPR